MTEVPLEIEANQVSAEDLKNGIEAILLVADEPLEAIALATALEVSVVSVEAALSELVNEYQQRSGGIELREVAGGFRLYTSQAAADLVEKYVRDGQIARLTQAGLETLAVVAYKQPVTRARISAIRGVNVDSVIKTLESRGLVEVSGSEADTGALLYRTTGLFLEKLGLNSLDDLEPIADHLPDLSTSVDLGDSI